LTGNRSDEEDQSFIFNNSHVFKKMPISCLNIDNYEASTELLIKFLCIFDKINSLRISPFPMDSSKFDCFKRTKDYDFVSKNNNITKVFLGQIDELKLNYFVFMNFWPRVEYLQMICTKDVNIEIIIRIILKKYAIYIPRLRSLCLCVTKINDKMMEQLQTVINRQKLLDSYTIEHNNNKLYLRWK
jgi:hypothetical protein